MVYDLMWGFLAPVEVVWSVAFLCSRYVTICSLLLLNSLPTMVLSQTTSHHSGSDHVSSDEACTEDSWETYFEHEQLKAENILHIHMDGILFIPGHASIL